MLLSKHYCGDYCDPYSDRDDFTQPCATGNKKNFLRYAALVTNLLVPMSLNTSWRRYLSTGKRISTDVSKILEQPQEWVIHVKQRKKKKTPTNICPEISGFCV